jgi:hypothetical protein
MFALSAPKLVNTPVLQPEKLTFAWKPGTPKPDEQVLKLKGGSASSSFTASSSDEDWLTVTPASDEPTNRSWQVKVDPEKVGPTGPNGTSGWIDVTSTEGFKTQEEVIVKVAPATPVASTSKAKKTSVTTPALPAAVVPAVPVTAPAAKTATKVAAPTATSTKPSVTSTKPPATVARPLVATPPPSASVKKQPANDSVDIN